MAEMPEAWEIGTVQDLIFGKDVCVLGVTPERKIVVMKGGAMGWDAANELRNLLVNDLDCRVWIEGFLHSSGQWRYRLVMRNPYGDERCG